MFGSLSTIVNALGILLCLSAPLITYNFEHSAQGLWAPAFLIMPLFGACIGTLLLLDTVLTIIARSGKFFFRNIMVWCCSLFIVLNFGNIYWVIDYIKVKCCLSAFARHVYRISPELTIYDWGEGGMVSMNVFNYLVKLERASALDISTLRTNIEGTPDERKFSLLYDKTCNHSLVDLSNGFYALTTVC